MFIVSTILPVPDPSPVTLPLAVAAQAYVTLVIELETSLSSKTTVNCTSEQEVAVPAIPIGSDLTVTV